MDLVRMSPDRALFMRRLEMAILADTSYQKSKVSSGDGAPRRGEHFLRAAMDYEIKLRATFDSDDSYKNWRRAASGLLHENHVAEHAFPIDDPLIHNAVRNGHRSPPTR